MLHLGSLHQESLSFLSTHLWSYYNKVTQRQYLQIFNIHIKYEVRRKVKIIFGGITGKQKANYAMILQKCDWQEI